MRKSLPHDARGPDANPQEDRPNHLSRWLDRLRIPNSVVEQYQMRYAYRCGWAEAEARLRAELAARGLLHPGELCRRSDWRLTVPGMFQLEVVDTPHGLIATRFRPVRLHGTMRYRPAEPGEL